MKTLLTALITFALVSPALANTLPLQEPTETIITATAQASTSIITTEKPILSASMASQTLTAIFNFLALLLHSTHSQTNTTPSFSSLLEDVFILIAQTSGKKGRELDIFMNDIKIDCNNTLKRSFEDLSASPNLNDYKRPSKNEEKEAKTQAALCNVATIVTGVANIVQNPHDKVNVGQSVGSILAGIINIALLASHKPRQQALTDLMESLNVTA
jgi:hypothetical protein